ncbi:hypothetical protein AVEN_240052-1 [Araneus ventricosus]|uniref:Uncharacterized protein n=1 Tax=Araneus ventricosus TaxID=182803 RepID=A0A4Y2VZC2_ARAVE|nr:hypothetical protein AVEN_240052-1 [Araneus ventricosus]
MAGSMCGAFEERCGKEVFTAILSEEVESRHFVSMGLYSSSTASETCRIQAYKNICCHQIQRRFKTVMSTKVVLIFWPFSVPPTQRPLVNQPPTSEKVLEVSLLRTKRKKKSNTPLEIPRKSEGKGSYFLYPFSVEKKMAKRIVMGQIRSFCGLGSVDPSPAADPDPRIRSDSEKMDL